MRVNLGHAVYLSDNAIILRMLSYDSEMRSTLPIHTLTIWFNFAVSIHTLRLVLLEYNAA